MVARGEGGREWVKGKGVGRGYRLPVMEMSKSQG